MKRNRRIENQLVNQLQLQQQIATTSCKRRGMAIISRNVGFAIGASLAFLVLGVILNTHLLQYQSAERLAGESAESLDAEAHKVLELVCFILNLSLRC